MKELKTITKKQILQWLEEVKDPEIPVLSLIGLGVITQVTVDDSGAVTIDMTPTFAGCPAMDYMVNDVKKVLEEKGITDYQVNVSFKKQWSSNNISAKGRKALKKFGLAPPPKHNMIVDLDILKNVNCPYCGSEDTTMNSPFGPTLCRSLHYCNSCKQAFEQFKPL
ncbi:MAG: phenylacetate-CoA oxygenase subunit PaaJ [Bacteroidetes bacterium]|nr:phenylacetate-CoA oxygenase subunit PaaJ [Bacteroidota bacterium]